MATRSGAAIGKAEFLAFFVTLDGDGRALVTDS